MIRPHPVRSALVVLAASLVFWGCAPVVRNVTSPPATVQAQDSRGWNSQGIRRAWPDKSVALPLHQLPSRHIIVPVDLGPTIGTVDFILDTGATLSVITPAIRDRLGIAPHEGQTVHGRGAGGNVPDVRVVELDRVRVGQRRYGQLVVAVMDLSGVEERLGRTIGGLLGRNFLQKHVVDVDFVARSLKFHPADAVIRQDVDVSQMTAIPYQVFAPGLIRVDASLDGSHNMPALVDLGAGRTIMNWRAAQAAGLRSVSPGAGTSESLMGADDRPIDGVHHTFGQLRLGNAQFAQPRIVVADLPVFKALGVADAPAMIFGVDLLRGRRFLVDYRQQILYVSEAREG